MIKKPTKCRFCKAESYISSRWVEGRKLQYYCKYCGRSLGDPFTPEKKRIESTKSVDVDEFGGFTYTVYDQYGRECVYSQTFRTKLEALTAARKDVNRHSAIEGYGPCTAVVWPAKVKVRGTVVKMNKNGKLRTKYPKK